MLNHRFLRQSGDPNLLYPFSGGGPFSVRTVTKKPAFLNHAVFHNCPLPDLHNPKDVTRPMMTIVKKMCDTRLPFHNGPKQDNPECCMQKRLIRQMRILSRRR